MNPPRLTWNGEQIQITLIARAWEGIARATVYLHTELQKALSVPNTGVSVRGKGRKSRTIYPHPSRPGEPPRLRTGWLRSHVVYELDRQALRSRVGLARNALYGLYLELGTRRMAARPWLLATLDAHLATLRTLAAGT